MTITAARVFTLFVLTAVPLPVLAAELVLSAPPRESAEKAQEVFQPIADYLGKVLGSPVVFRYSDNWLSYQSDMQADKYDIVFDGPHFVSWRMAKYGHKPVVSLPGELAYAVVVKKDESRIDSIEKVAGRMVCSPTSPNLGALSVAALFENPARQPLFVNTKGFKQAFEGLMANKCPVAVMQVGIYAMLDKDQTLTRPLVITKGLPNQAFTASSRVTDAKIETLREALLSEAGKAATAKLREEYAGKDFIPAKDEKYSGHAILLKDNWGFELQGPPKVALKNNP